VFNGLNVTWTRSWTRAKS